VTTEYIRNNKTINNSYVTYFKCWRYGGFLVSMYFVHTILALYLCQIKSQSHKVVYIYNIKSMLITVVRNAVVHVYVYARLWVELCCRLICLKRGLLS